jgi:hypothetical protein
MVSRRRWVTSSSAAVAVTSKRTPSNDTSPGHSIDGLPSAAQTFYFPSKGNAAHDANGGTSALAAADAIRPARFSCRSAAPTSDKTALCPRTYSRAARLRGQTKKFSPALRRSCSQARRRNGFPRSVGWRQRKRRRSDSPDIAREATTPCIRLRPFFRGLNSGKSPPDRAATEVRLFWRRRFGTLAAVLVGVCVHKHPLKLFGHLPVPGHEREIVDSCDGPRRERRPVPRVACIITIRRVRRELSQIALDYRFGAARTC